jgi:hypothetical protein
MKLDKLKELLIKKSEDNPNLQTLIKYAQEDFLLDHVIESLEKMARASQHRNANLAVQHFGSEVDENLHPDMIRDALSHHVSGYKSAIKNKNNDVAHQHVSKVFKIMHMTNKLTDDGGVNHSNGALSVESVCPKPWERNNFTTMKENKKGGKKYSTDTKGWSRPVPKNIDWLQYTPHHSHDKETDVHQHKGAYPFEQIKVNGKHIHVEDNDNTTSEFEAHPFDAHPIMENYNKAPRSFDEDSYKDYIESHDKYHDEDHMDKYFDKHEALQEQNPEEYAARGSKASDPVHGDPIQKPDAASFKEETLTSKPGTDKAETKTDKERMAERDSKIEAIKKDRTLSPKEKAKAMLAVKV